ncbi:MAG: DUF547 domain-containing protein [Anaerolineales bacterium]|nr:DUF547 domain-containing protein [Anaerolineales bacterium]
MTTQNMILTPGPRRSSVHGKITWLGNQIADRLTGSYDGETLNPPPWLTGPSNPAQVLVQSAKAMKAEALDPATGLVDYGKLASGSSYARFRELTRSLPNCDPSDLADQATRMAFWINLYNALILDAVVHYKIQGSLLRHFWIFRRAAYNVGGMRFSAEDIEHGILRGNRPHPTYHLRMFTADDPRLELALDLMDPRIHFALVCGARSCPPIAFYDAEKLNLQLDQATSSFINAGGAHFDKESKTLGLSKIFSWYQSDFGGREGVLSLIQSHLTEQIVFPEQKLQIRYLPYDWSVNTLV